jgi:DNA uptake protein ComE-like DNA-binding protein
MKPVRNDSIIILVCLIAIAAFLIGKKVGSKEDYTEVVPEDTVAFQSNWGRGERHSASRAHIYYNVEEKKAERFAFDPNTADSTQLLRLGLRPFIVRNIYKYRAKGGRFRKPEDFARMYGLGKEEYKSLEPYIKISSDYQPASSLISETEKSSLPKDSLRYPVKLSVGEHIALNTADTTMLKRVPGIGSGYARAIVNYRNRLGGYVDVNQLLDIKGISPEALQYIVLGNSDVKKLDVNHLSLNQLKQHPYLNFYQARALVESRRLHGPLRSAADLRLISDFTEADIKRLIPYLQF